MSGVYTVLDAVLKGLRIMGIISAVLNAIIVKLIGEPSTKTGIIFRE